MIMMCEYFLCWFDWDLSKQCKQILGLKIAPMQTMVVGLWLWGASPKRSALSGFGA